ncbi:MAG: hypothetical protein HQ474_07140 [Flammeovirgaceae bacterium]|jgi:hypothetical protein|nr:hypothetical protein [Flammeovirgaceae bacterium]|tara:strand:+ start:78 stop:521 length:444 start_codon:yes stop_codon:yes gene_type:complete
MTEEKDNFQLDKKWLGKGLTIGCTINQDGFMIALAYNHDNVVSYNSDWLEKEQKSWTEKGTFSVPLQRPLPIWIILETKTTDCFIINEEWVGRRLLITYETSEGKTQSYNHDKYFLNHRAFITAHEDWNETRVFMDSTKGPVPKFSK